MARFQLVYDEIFTVPVSADRARAYFGDVGRIADDLDDVERVDMVDPHTLHVVMTPLERGPVTFRGDYRCRYVLQPDGTLVWEPAGPGNVWMRGRASFRGDGNGGARVDFHQELEVEIEMSWLVSTVAGPIVNGELRGKVRRYLDRARLSLVRTATA